MIRFAVFAALVTFVSACAPTRQATPSVASFDEITVKRINVIGEDGSSRIVLSNEDRFPLPILDGDTLDARSISASGILFYKLDGDEAGGFAVPDGGDTEQVAMILDYSNSDGLLAGIRDSGEDGYSAIFGIRDRQPLGASPFEAEGGSAGPLRVMLANNNGTAMLMLNDGEGRPRLRLSVTSEGEAVVEVLDANGEVVDSLPRD